jgi:hypothetical protein
VSLTFPVSIGKANAADPAAVGVTALLPKPLLGIWKMFASIERLSRP